MQDGGIGKAWTAVGRDAPRDPRDRLRRGAARARRRRRGGVGSHHRLLPAGRVGHAGRSRAGGAGRDRHATPIGSASCSTRLQTSPAAAGAGMGATAAALLQLLRTAVDAATAQGGDADQALDTHGRVDGRLTPEMLLGVLAAKHGGWSGLRDRRRPSSSE